jgi:hypothetical protein
MTTEVGAVFCGPAPSDGLVAEYLFGGDIALDSAGLHNGLIAGATWVAEMHTDFRSTG